jgi:hypothetical protein
MTAQCVVACGKGQARCQAAGLVRQPASPEEGNMSVALTDSGTYWRCYLWCHPPHRPSPEADESPS